MIPQPELEGGVSQPGGGGEALTHTFSMPEPSLPGPGQTLTVFRGRSRGETEASCAPVLPALPKGPRFQTEAIICSEIFIHFFWALGKNDSLFMLLSLLPQALSFSVGGRS